MIFMNRNDIGSVPGLRLQGGWKREGCLFVAVSLIIVLEDYKDLVE